MDTWKFAHCSKILSRCKVNSALAMLLPWVPEVFFSLGATELSGEAAKESREAARKKTSGTNG